MQVLGPGQGNQNQEKTTNAEPTAIKITHNVTVSKSNKSGVNERSEPQSLKEIQAQNNEISDTRAVVTNNNQVKWNTERYFRYLFY